MSNRQALFVQRIETRASAVAIQIYGRLITRGLDAAQEADRRTWLRDIMMGQKHLWGVFSIHHVGALAVFVTQVNEDQDGRWICVSALAGRGLRHWAQALGAAMVDYAKQENCRCVRFAGKRGWCRVLPEWRIVGDVGGFPMFERGIA